MVSVKSIEVKKLIYKSSYLDLEYEEIEYKCKDVFEEIWIYIKDKYPDIFEAISNAAQPVNEMATDLSENPPEEKTYLPKDIKKLYHKIINKTHPDKVEGKEEEFRRATDAYKSNDVSKLLSMCSKLEIEFGDISEDALNVLRKNIESLEIKLDNLYNSTAWAWFSAKTEKDKESIALHVLQSKGIDISGLHKDPQK